ncbi:uncharacterized protein [Amphiura filiformis]|uniref:uncharacterized protein n=1 Tax=Amphiura filiformis TaxID=82378 RepID=UPI003B21501E
MLSSDKDTCVVPGDVLTTRYIKPEVRPRKGEKTWLAENDRVVIGELLPQGYSFMNFPRKLDPHGGIGIIYKSNLNIQKAPTDIETPSFEHASVIIKKLGIRLILVYRPPPSKENGLKVPQFLEEFDAFINEISMAPVKTLLLGDFNIHVDLPSKPDSARFLESLAENGFQQHVHQSTHKDGHTLDLIISRNEENLVTKCQVLPTLGSDHELINCAINCEKPQPMKVSSNVRNIKGIDSVSFANDLASSLSDLDFGEDSAEEMLGKFDSSILSVLNTHAPPRQRARSIKPTSPWFDETIRDARRKRRQCERKWLKSKNKCDHDDYVEQTKVTSKLIQHAKENYYQEQLENSSNKNMFVTLNKLLNNVTKQLPDFDNLNEMCNSFARFFVEKVSKIRQDLDSVPSALPDCKPLEYCQNLLSKNVSLSSFNQVTVEEVCKIISSMPLKSCALDTIPLWLFKENVELLCKPLTSIINVSLSTGVFPSKLREAIVSPS